MSTLMKISYFLLLIFSYKASAQEIPDYTEWVKSMCEHGYPDSPRDRELACEEYESMIHRSKMKPPQYPSSAIEFIYNDLYRTPILIENKQQVLLRYSVYLPDEKKARLEIIDGKNSSSFIFPTPFNQSEPHDELIRVEKISDEFILFKQNRILATNRHRPDGYWNKYFYFYDRRTANLVSVFANSIPLRDDFYYEYSNLSITKKNGIILFKLKMRENSKKNVAMMFIINSS